jgi:hypothetical protein
MSTFQIGFGVETQRSAGQPIAQQPSSKLTWNPSKKSQSVKVHLLCQRLMGKPETLPEVPARFAKKPPGTHVKLVGSTFSIGKNRDKGVPKKPTPSPSQVLGAAIRKGTRDLNKKER